MGKLRVGINGFGRIGRILFRAGFDQIDIVGINDLGDPKTSAHLLKYDSTHGIYEKTVSHGEHFLEVNGKKIHLSSHKDPAQIPWHTWEVDVVLECTGAFKKKDDFLKHITGGARLVFVSSPATGVDHTIVYGINHHEFDSKKHKVISNASCTTNCLAPLAKILHQNFMIEKGVMTTVHSYTNDQKVLDMAHDDLRRARSAALSMIPTTTGAAKAVGLVLPELKGKIDGMAIRVPTPNVSLVDFTFLSQKKMSIESINSCLKEASQKDLKGILQCEDAPLVSVDFMGNRASSIVDTLSTMVIGDNMAKVLSWYDNEMGFSHRMVDFVKYIQSQGF